MSRLENLIPAQLDEQQRALYTALIAGKRSTGPQVFPLANDDGSLTGPFNALLHAPELGVAVAQVGEQLRYAGVLPAEVREALILTVAARWASEFEWYAHEAVARHVGVPDPVIDALRAGDDPTAAAKPSRAAVRVAQHLLARATVPDDDYAEVVAAFGEAGAVELTVLVGYYQLLAGVLETFRVGLPSGVAPIFGES